VNRILTFFSRISVRIFAFNFLIAFLPIAGIFSLGTYERQLLQDLEHALVQQGRVFAAALADSTPKDLGQNALRIVLSMRQRQEARIRVVDASGRLLADSSSILAVDAAGQPDQVPENDARSGLRSASAPPVVTEERETRETLLYRIAVFPIKVYRKFFKPPPPPLESTDFYSGVRVLTGPEIQAALAGRYGAATRVSATGQRSVTLYSALPVSLNGTVSGAVLVSQSTYRILSDLYDLRLDIFTIFLYSLGTAVVLSFLVSATITVPLRRLRTHAGLILDPHGRLRGRLPPTRRRDEIGDMSRRFSELTQRLEKQIRQAESFASDLSHEFKNPLASIRSAVELLSSARESPQKGDLVALVLDEVNRMERLLVAVRDLSRLDSGILGEQPAPVDPKALAKSMIEGMRRRGATDRVQIHVEGDASLVAVPPERLLQCLENIVENAVGFSPEGGEISIMVRRQSPYSVITVSDQGQGIPDEHRDRIFERFFTFRPEGDPARCHTGLGLAIVKTIVEAYGGSIRTANGTPRGAIFEVRLPLA
jgi:two-component system sensor histidine kinase ChvG